MAESVFNEIKFTDKDVINNGDFTPEGGYNPHHMRPWLLHDHGFCLCVVFACCLQDALDEAVDAGKLDRFQTGPILEADKVNFQTLHDAAKNGDMAIISAIRKSDQKQVSLICAMSHLSNGDISPVPFAVMIEENPYELFEDPTQP